MAYMEVRSYWFLEYVVQPRYAWNNRDRGFRGARRIDDLLKVLDSAERPWRLFWTVVAARAAFIVDGLRRHGADRFGSVPCTGDRSVWPPEWRFAVEAQQASPGRSSKNSLTGTASAKARAPTRSTLAFRLPASISEMWLCMTPLSCERVSCVSPRSSLIRRRFRARMLRAVFGDAAIRELGWRFAFGHYMI